MDSPSVMNEFSVHLSYALILAKSVHKIWICRLRFLTILTTFSDTVQLFSILNSLVIVLFLSGMVAMILLRTLHKDIACYNQMDSGKDVQEEFGWKLVHGDLFQPPRKGMLLSVFLGSGAQLLCPWPPSP